MASIKTEPGIKPEPDEDDLYEDAGDLDMTNSEQNVWLVKLPKWLMERWHELDDDEEIKIGEVKVAQVPDGNKLRLTLSDHPVNKDLPREYDMNVTNMSVQNTFIFTEKDMPGYEEAEKRNGPPIPSRILAQRRQNNDKSKSERYTPYARKGIPKLTAMVGTVKHEATVLPRGDANFFKLYQKRQAEALEPKFKTKWMDEKELVNPNAISSLGRSGASAFEDMVKTSVDKKKPQDNKAARMPKNELIDALFACFKQYPYWPIKGLKEKLNQPEAYLKSTLEEIAILKRNGKFALKWCLKPEYTNGLDPDQIAADMEREGKSAAAEAGNDDDDDDEVEMEDVI